MYMRTMHMIMRKGMYSKYMQADESPRSEPACAHHHHHLLLLPMFLPFGGRAAVAACATLMRSWLAKPVCVFLLLAHNPTISLGPSRASNLVVVGRICMNGGLRGACGWMSRGVVSSSSSTVRLFACTYIGTSCLPALYGGIAHCCTCLRPWMISSFFQGNDGMRGWHGDGCAVLRVEGGRVCSGWAVGDLRCVRYLGCEIG